jgi:hypothetical protein
MSLRFALPMMDDDRILFDGSPECLVPGLRSAMHEADHDGLGLRSLIERVEVPPKPWPTTRHSRASRQTASGRVRRAPVRGTV